MDIPEEVITNVKSGKCILFMGAMVSASSPKGAKFKYKKAPPGGKELALRLAAKCSDCPDEDKTNLHVTFSL